MLEMLGFLNNSMLYYAAKNRTGNIVTAVEVNDCLIQSRHNLKI
jgi:hypothetical protein